MVLSKFNLNELKLGMTVRGADNYYSLNGQPAYGTVVGVERHGYWTLDLETTKKNFKAIVLVRIFWWLQQPMRITHTSKDFEHIEVVTA